MPEYATDRQRAKVVAIIEARGLPRRKSRKALDAYVSWGFWVADCPCKGGEVVTPGELLECGSCGMSSDVKFPAEAAEIDRLLGVRPPENQNWKTEDMAELLGENIAAGLET